jgi:hypothetical protein
MESVPVVGTERVDAVVDAALPLEEEDGVVLRQVAGAVWVTVIMLAALALFIVNVLLLRKGDLEAHFLAFLTAILPPTPPPTVAAMITHTSAIDKRNFESWKPQIVFLL